MITVRGNAFLSGSTSFAVSGELVRSSSSRDPNAGLAVNAGNAVRFGLALEREAGVGDVNATRCRITTLTVNRDGTAPPRDTGGLLP